MGTAWVAVWGFFLVAFQATTSVTPEEPTCVAGFKSDVLIFKVHRKHLVTGTRLGNVGFSDCSGRTLFLFSSSNSHFAVQADGVLKVKRPTDIRWVREFNVSSWDHQGHAVSVPVRVVHHEHHNGNHHNHQRRHLHHHQHHQHQHHQHHNHQHKHTKVQPANNTKKASDGPVPILHFRKTRGELRRSKRDWVIPDLKVPENDRGPYPLKVSQIRSSEDKVKKIHYSITGPGSTEEPVGLFTMDRNTGNLYLTQPLDREAKDTYMFQAFAVAESGGTSEDPMDIIVKVIDQNDNKPTFTQDTFLGEVAEASPKGFEVIRVEATDIDEPNTANSDIRYRILSQDPLFPSDNLFIINPVTGGIRVNAGGLDREKYPKYTLVVEAADLEGEGLTGTATVILTVTDSNDNAPAFTQSSYEASVDENKVDSHILMMTVTDGDEALSPAWNAVFKIVDGDPGGHFAVSTGAIKREGILSIVKGLDFETSTKHTLLIAVTNDVEFATPLPTATATVVVHVLDVNEAPIFDPVEKLVSKREVLAVDSEMNASDGPVPILHFRKTRGELRRSKRDWVIPDLKVPENDRGPYPLKVSQIRSSEDKVKKIHYSITGPGSTEEPVGLFTMDRNTGNLYLTQPLDREAKDTYMFQAFAVAEGGGTSEDPMDIIVKVIDQNDNKPTFTQDTFLGEVAEASPKGFEVIRVEATDIDEPNTANSDIRYRILSQDPLFPSDNLFIINPVTGGIRVNAGGLDREKYPKYTLVVEAADMEGEGLTKEAKVILTVTDSNDNAPAFTQSSYEASVDENKVDSHILMMTVTDGDEPLSPAWNAVFKIVDGDPGGHFAVRTGVNKQEGILSTVKGLDFERSTKHTLLIAVTNDVEFATPLPTATATVVVHVLDVNEAPIFDPVEKIVSKREDLAVDSDLLQYTASDPDTARKQKVMYRVIRDPAGWLNVAKDTGLIKVKHPMDRESLFVKDNKYTALIGAYDNDEVPATGTGTLIIQLEDVNDNAPTIQERTIQVCRKESASQLLSVTDKDGPGFAAPYSVSLQGLSKSNWTARMNESKTGILLNLAVELERGDYTVVLRVADNQGLEQDSTVQATVCDCTGEEVICKDRLVAGSGLPLILGILGGILLLLMLVLLLLLFARKKKGDQKVPLLQDDDVRDNIYHYDEEGGGEDDQDYDLGVLHRGLDNRPEVFRNDVVPNFMPAPLYRPRPANPDEIGNFIDDNMKAADNDPTAPPYDSLLVFDYEGGASDAGSLSSLNSTSSGDQDYNCLNDWGPRFKKLSDMYGGGEDDDDML
ncbi:B-cadherin [Clinocottus analis]|uniref:B-cadherin n=1 Tax=Clinocottus analis TaxID=304258 RepID=UPI0035C0C2E6